MTTARSASYRPALDGIRALSVLAVMLYHGLVGWSPGGFLGVDVFFVLSGYLITSLLLREWDRWGSLDIVTFYRRRARRLLPALVLLLGAVAVWAAVVAAPDKLGRIRWDGISTLLYTANWRYVFAQQSYFDKYGDPSPFLHTWSLAIEEQFYLLFPLILVGLLRLTRGRRARVGAILALGALASALLMAWLFDPATDPSRVYYGTDTRAQELLIGAVLALALLKMRPLEGRPRVAAAAAGVVALGGVVAAFLLLNDQDAALYRGGFALFCVLVAVLVFSVEMVTKGPAARLLSVWPVAWVGLISYGLYLWHWPVYIALTPDRTGLDGTWLLLVRMGVTLLIATASFYLVERPIRAGGLRRLRRPWGRTVAALGMPLAFVALVVATLGSRPPPLPDSPFATTAVRGSGANSLLVVGDSVALNLTVGFPAQSFPDWSVASSVHLGCGLAVQALAFDGSAAHPNHECDKVLDVWGEAVAKRKPQAVLMTIGSWEVFDHVVDGKVLAATGDQYAAYLRDRLEKARAVLTAHGAQLLLTNVPCYHQASERPSGHDLAPDRNDPKRAEAVNRVLTGFAAAHPDDTTVLDLAGYLCPGGRFAAEKNGVQMRPDGLHFSRAGANLVWRWLMPQIVQRDPDAARIRVLTIGDSVPLGLFENFSKNDFPDLSVVDSTLLGCSLLPYHSSVDGETQPLPDGCKPWAESIPRVVDEQRPAVGMVFLGVGEQFDKIVDGRTLKFGSTAYDAWLSEQLKKLVDVFRTRGIPVVLPTVPCHRVVETATSNVPAVINDQHRIDHLNELVRTVAASYDQGVTVADLGDHLCKDGYTNTLDGHELRKDGLHFTAFGAQQVWSFLARSIRVAAGRDAQASGSAG